MKIICTGSEGFVGKHTTQVLRERGYKVLGFDLVNGYDLLNYQQVLDAIEPGDKILHLAAIARFSDADANPLLAYRVNCQGTENIVKAAEEKGAERIVYSSTGSVYMQLLKEPPITEDFPIRGNSVYGCSKTIAEKMIMEGKVPYLILRYAHLYGIGKIGHGAIGGFLAKMKAREKPILFGGQQTNDFTYIKDITEANILALETNNSEAINQAYNIGTGTELTTIRVFEIMRDFFNYRKEFEIVPARQVDAMRFAYDVSKAEKLLKFKAKYSFEEGLKNWFKNDKLI